MFDVLGVGIGEECEYDEECSHLDIFSYCIEVTNPLHHDDIRI